MAVTLTKLTLHLPCSDQRGRKSKIFYLLDRSHLPLVIETAASLNMSATEEEYPFSTETDMFTYLKDYGDHVRT